MKKTIFLFTFLIGSQLSFASGGHFEDNLANIISWLVMFVLPFAGIYLFWKAHIYPEVVAEKNNHPQLQAIKIMCLLSLFVGGLLWPVALIWASYKYPKKNNTAPENQIDNPNTQAKSEPITTESPAVDNIDSSSENTLHT